MTAVEASRSPETASQALPPQPMLIEPSESSPTQRTGPWFSATINEARTRRFIRALKSAKSDLQAIPEHRRKELERLFDEATEQARAYAEYRRRT